MTNVGDKTDTYTLLSILPSGFSGQFAQQTVTVPSGLGNFRDVELQVTPQSGAAVGSQNFTVRAVSTSDSTVQDTASGIVAVVGVGVTVKLAPSVGSPGSAFQMTVTNTGVAQEI